MARPILLLAVASLACATDPRRARPISMDEPRPPPGPVEKANLPPDPPGSVRVSRDVGLSHLAIDPRFAPHRPRLPPVLSRKGNVISTLTKICVTDTGKVREVLIVEGGDILLDADLRTTVATWHFNQHVVDGKVVPFCFPLIITIEGQL
jgi:hypothetical protein